MITKRSPLLFLLAVALMLVAACGGAASPSASVAPSAGGGPVTTEDQAIAAVIASEPRFTGITRKDSDMIGQSSWYEVVPASGVGAFLVRVSVGWGDCQAGCIDVHTWTYAVAPDGTVTLQSETGGDVPDSAWPSPGGAADGGAGATGIRVTAVASPTCPVETVPPDPACAPRPVPGVAVRALDSEGNALQEAILDAAGTAFLAVPPGTYVVTAEAADGLMGPPDDQTAVVDAGQSTSVILAFDTGIR